MLPIYDSFSENFMTTPMWMMLLPATQLGRHTTRSMGGRAAGRN